MSKLHSGNFMSFCHCCKFDCVDGIQFLFSFARNPATFLHAYTCLPLAYATRQAAGAILQDVADSGVLFAILMCKHKVKAYSSSLFFSSVHLSYAWQ